MIQEEKFQIYKEILENETVVYLNGELDLSAAPDMRADLDPIVNQADRKLTLNLRDLLYIDSTGIGIIISILKARDALQAPFQVTEIPPKIKRLFDITGITKYLVSQPTISASERKEDIV